MQLTTINKVVSLFLIGGLVLLAVVCLSWKELDKALIQGSTFYDFLQSKGQTLLVIAGAVSLLALAAAVGAVVDTLASFTVRPWLRRCANHRGLAAFFGQPHSFDDFSFWRDRFRSLMKSRYRYKSLEEHLEGHEITMAAAIFFKTAGQGLVSWAESHYAVFVYATNLVFLSLLLPIVPFVLRRDQASGMPLCAYFALAIALGWVFSSMAVDRFLYTHEVSFRQASLILLEEKEAPESASKEAHNTAAQPDGSAAG